MVKRSMLLASALALAGVRQAASAADALHPAVVELYRSQGCSSCPPADLVLNALADRPDVLALSFAVTYWDQLGWKDTFAQPGFTRRQLDYAREGGRGEVATPQVVINGRGVVTGNQRADVDAAIQRYDRSEGSPVITATPGAVGGGAGLGHGLARALRSAHDRRPDPRRRERRPYDRAPRHRPSADRSRSLERRVGPFRVAGGLAGPGERAPPSDRDWRPDHRKPPILGIRR